MIEEAVMTSSYAVVIIISSDGHYWDMADLPISPLNQSNGSILNDNNVIITWSNSGIV